MPDDILSDVRIAAAKRLLFLPHAVGQMARPGRMITSAEVEAVVTTGQLVEDYPEDVRGHSCLLLGYVGDERAIHVVCAPNDAYSAIITAYLPDPAQWTVDFQQRV